MDPLHRSVLTSNRRKLVLSLKPSELYDGLIEKGIFTQDMIDEIKSSGPRRDQARQLLCDLERRGSRAFPASVRPASSPWQTSCWVANNHHQASLWSSHHQPLKSFLALSSNPYPFSYKMDASPCGHCLIINNVEFEPNTDLSFRKGSNVDCAKLEKRFKSLNFIQIRHELSLLSKKDHSQFDCCVVIILSHGTEVNHNRFPGAVYGVDGTAVPVQLITTYLNGEHCPSLQGKPKLFFIQACGGGQKDTGFEVPPDELISPCGGGADDQTDAIPLSSSSDSLSTSDEPDARATLPTASDILISYSTFPGFVSFRDPLSGSWYVDILDQILEENAVTDDLDTMLMLVNNKVSQNSANGVYKQMPGSFNFLRKHLYFQSPRDKLLLGLTAATTEPN
ncbi:hypothetical protein CRUP_015229 [Coryphaenoides rupestris]|nr:hypothetical protein CRUP_015229 [Coryphaenoides rupestris]